MKEIKYYDFKEVSDFFYKIILDNSSVFEGIVKPKNILQTQNESGEANISVLTNWVSLDELKEELMFEDFWDNRYLGFGCLMQCSGGHDRTSQDAFNNSTAIIQRLKVLLDNNYVEGFSVENEDLKMTIYKIDYASVTDPDNPTSDFALSICRIIGIWKFYEVF